jgi:hypothetical protein
MLKNPNKNSINDDDSLTGTFTLGSPNRTWNTPLQRDSNLILYYTFNEASGSALDYSGSNYTGTLSGPERVTTIGTNKAMYYDASGTDYISTPSFAIPNTGIITIEAWVKSKTKGTDYQAIIGDATQSATVGYILAYRDMSTNKLIFKYADGTAARYAQFSDFFLNLDDQ